MITTLRGWSGRPWPRVWLLAGCAALAIVAGGSPVAWAAGTFSTRFFAGDEDCDVSSLKTYTHAYNLCRDTALPNFVVNGVEFLSVPPTSGVSPSGPDFSTVGFKSIKTSFGYTVYVTGQMGSIVQSFNFGTASGNQGLTLTGLEVGKHYLTTFYCAGFGYPESGDKRLATFTPSDGGEAFRFDEDLPGLGRGSLLQYDYVAQDTSLAFAIKPDQTGRSFHLYAFTNEIVGGGPPPIPGDANHDGKVDDLDASILAANWQRTGDAVWEQADFNDDTNVNDLDASILAANWQYGVGAAVPEPSLAALLVGGLTLVVLRRRLSR